jgi:hypothetical protein
MLFGVDQNHDRRRRTRTHLIVAAALVLAAWSWSSPSAVRAAVQSSAALTGIVRDGGNRQLISGARVVVTSGPDAGLFAISDERGVFAFPKLTAGVIDLEGTKDGYVSTRIQNLALEADSAIDVPLTKSMTD